MKIQFTISPENISDFAGVLSENEMNNKIAGNTKDGNVLIAVFPSRDNRDSLEDLEELAETDE